MKIYVQKITEETIVKFSRRELEDALERLDNSGAQEIGIPVELQ